MTTTAPRTHSTTATPARRNPQTRLRTLRPRPVAECPTTEPRPADRSRRNLAVFLAVIAALITALLGTAGADALSTAETGRHAVSARADVDRLAATGVVVPAEADTARQELLAAQADWRSVTNPDPAITAYLTDGRDRAAAHDAVKNLSAEARSATLTIWGCALLAALTAYIAVLLWPRSARNRP